MRKKSRTSSRWCVLPLLVTRVASLATPPPVLDRIGARSKLLGLLGPSAGAGVVPLAGELVGLVQELERSGGMVPATPAFLALGLQGRWILRAVSGPDDPCSDLDLLHASIASLGTGEQEFELDASTRAGGLCGRLRSTCEFVVADADDDAEPIAGRLLTEAGVYLTTHADTLHLLLATQGMTLPRLPRAPLEDVIGALHAKLSAEFRTDEGMRVSLQTMYLDERVHISRCTTRGLAGLCAVHVRRDIDPAPHAPGTAPPVACASAIRCEPASTRTPSRASAKREDPVASVGKTDVWRRVIAPVSWRCLTLRGLGLPSDLRPSPRSG